LQPFRPLIRHPHLLTIAASLWPRRLDTRRFPVEEKLFESEPGVRVLVQVQRPTGSCRGGLVLVHGLEGSSSAGYMKSMAQAALQAGFAAHRFNLRNCGDAERLAPTIYNAGQTCDLLAYLESVKRGAGAPLFLVGFSLGGNIALKLAGELGNGGGDLLAGVCAASAPIDLGESCRQLSLRHNHLYERRFVGSMRRRIRAMNRLHPGFFPETELDGIRTLYDFDDRVTAPLSGFRDAGHYYSTQSAIGFLERIRVPTLLIQAQDDPMIPFEIYGRPAVADDPLVELIAAGHGGHLGFLSRSRPRFWLDGTVIAWMKRKS